MCIHVYTYIHIYIHTYIHIYIYIHFTYILEPPIGCSSLICAHPFAHPSSLLIPHLCSSLIFALLIPHLCSSLIFSVFAGGIVCMYTCMCVYMYVDRYVCACTRGLGTSELTGVDMCVFDKRPAIFWRAAFAHAHAWIVIN